MQKVDKQNSCTNLPRTTRDNISHQLHDASGCRFHNANSGNVVLDYLTDWIIAIANLYKKKDESKLNFGLVTV